MDISIIIVSYNTRELLKDCLISVKSAKSNLKVEVFVVDNDSNDKTKEMVKNDFPNVTLIANKKNVGFSKANNQALKKAKGKYILILNPDTILSPDTLNKMHSFMQENKDIAIATCRVELPNGKLDRDCRRHFPSPWRAFSHFVRLSNIFKHSKLFDQYYMGYLPDNIEHEIDSCVGAFMFIRKSTLDKVGLFDEDFFFYGEDLDLCWRFKQKGFKIYYTPVAKIIHYKGAASGLKSTSAHLTKATQESKKKALFESVHAMELFYKKHLQHVYLFFINWLVLISLKVLEKIRTKSANI